VKDGLSLIKREIKIGQTNENNAVVNAGLKKGEVIYLSIPQEKDNLPIEKLKGKK
jgi:hypothetical protein